MSGLAAWNFWISCVIAFTRVSKTYCQYSISTALALVEAMAAALSATPASVYRKRIVLSSIPDRRIAPRSLVAGSTADRPKLIQCQAPVNKIIHLSYWPAERMFSLEQGLTLR